MSHESPCLLGLPVELRLQIWSMYFDKSLLREKKWITCVCRTIRYETIPFLLHDELYFPYINSFLAWTSRCGPEVLVHVKDIHCYCMPRKPTSSRSEELEEAPPGEEESRKPLKLLDEGTVGRALSSVPNLQQLKMDVPWPHRYAGPAILRHQEDLVRAVAGSSSKLKRLNLITDLIILDCLQGFQNLVELTWSGYSLSSPSETLEVLTLYPHCTRLLSSAGKDTGIAISSRS